LARYIFDGLSERLQDTPVRLCWTMVAEKDSSMAFYEGCEDRGQTSGTETRS
jgi:hypothetical protein